MPRDFYLILKGGDLLYCFLFHSVLFGITLFSAYDPKCRIRHFGSPSISSTFFPACASPIPRFAQVVVLPTPPFWLAMAMICVFNDFTSFLNCSMASGNRKSRHFKN